MDKLEKLATLGTQDTGRRQDVNPGDREGCEPWGSRGV